MVTCTRSLLLAALTTTMVAALLLPACGGSRTGGKVEYSVTATKNYDKGMTELKEKDWVAAAKYFSFIKARFAYSKFSVLAELRMSDAEFGAGHYLQAIDGYKLFIKFHPTHAQVVNGYAAYRIGESYLRLLPSGFWLLPPRFEKDQSATGDAHRELSTFLKKYPKSPYVPKAKQALTKVNHRLAEHEMYVARFYWKRNKPMGTVLRLRRLLKRHAGTKLDGDALWLLAKAYEKVKMPARAKDTYEHSRVTTQVMKTLATPNAPPHASAPSRGGQTAAGRWIKNSGQLINFGREHYVAGDYAKAEQFLAAAVGQDARFADLYNMLGRRLSRPGALRGSRRGLRRGA